MLKNVVLGDSIGLHCDGMRKHLNAVMVKITQAQSLSAANARAARHMGDLVRDASSVTDAYPLYCIQDRASQVGSHLNDVDHQLWLLDEHLRLIEEQSCGRKPRFHYQQSVVVKNGGHYQNRRGQILTIEFDQDAETYVYAVLIDAEQYLRTDRIAQGDLSLPEASYG
jgi:hypothetical protein